MNETTTILVSIIDRSGSMSGLEKKTIEGFNHFLSGQRELKGEVEVNTVLFDDQFEVLHNELPLDHVPLMTEEQYYTRGSTALLDAIGRSIHHLEVRIKRSEKPLADKVIFLIITDGMENSSQHYSFDVIRSLIKKHTLSDQWEFIFMGANMDAVKEASRFGIHHDRAMNYRATEKGVEHVYKTANLMATNIREGRQFNSREYELPEDKKSNK